MRRATGCSSASWAALRPQLLFLLLVLGIVVAFFLDIMWGATSLSVWDALWTGDDSVTGTYVVRHFRLPKALTALFAGAGVAVAGLQMQSLFRNPLADTSILGINSGAGVGVAIYTMAYAFFPTVALFNSGVSSWGIILAACIGAAVVLLLITGVASRVRSVVSVLIVGVMVGFLASFAGGLIGLFILGQLHWVLILPGVVPHFFCGATAGVFGNAVGGRLGASIGAFLHGILITFLPVWLLPVLGDLGFANTTFSDADFGAVGIILGNVIHMLK